MQRSVCIQKLIVYKNTKSQLPPNGVSTGSVSGCSESKPPGTTQVVNACTECGGFLVVRTRKVQRKTASNVMEMRMKRWCWRVNLFFFFSLSLINSLLEEHMQPYSAQLFVILCLSSIFFNMYTWWMACVPSSSTKQHNHHPSKSRASSWSVCCFSLPLIAPSTVLNDVKDFPQT